MHARTCTVITVVVLRQRPWQAPACQASCKAAAACGWGARVLGAGSDTLQSSTGSPREEAYRRPPGVSVARQGAMALRGARRPLRHRCCRWMTMSNGGGTEQWC